MSENAIYVDEKGNVVGSTMQGLAGGMPSYLPTGDNKKAMADLIDKIRPDAIVEIMRNKLLGKEEINGKWVKVEALKERSLSDKGAWEIANLMLGVSSQNVALSKLSDAEIRARTLQIIKSAQLMMLKNWREYGITGTEQLRYIHELVISNTFITLKQPEGEGIRKLIMGTSSFTTAQTPQIEQKRGFLSSLFRRK